MAAVSIRNSTLFSDANLIAYYELESNSNDSKGSYNMTDANSPTYGAGLFGNAVTYNGSNQSSRKDSNYGLAYNSDKTYLMWVKMVSEPTSGNMVLLGGFMFATNPGNYTNWYYKNTGGVYTLDTNTGTDLITSQLGTSNWHMLVVTWNNSSGVVKIYLDGSPGTDGSTWNGDYSTQTTNFVLGAAPGTSQTFPANCLIDDVAIFSRVLTPTEISNHWSGADALPSGSPTGFMTTNSMFWGA